MKEITSVHNPAVQALRDLSRPKTRREAGLFRAESMKMVREAIEHRLCRTLIVEKARAEEYAGLIGQAQESGCEVLVVTQAIMQAISEAKTPQGVACTVSIPA